MTKAPRHLTASASAEIVEHLTNVRGMSDADIARVVGRKKSFVGMVRLRELTLSTEQAVSLADALGMPFGEFLMGINPVEPQSEKDRRRAERCDDVIRQADRLRAAIEKSRASKAPQ